MTQQEPSQKLTWPQMWEAGFYVSSESTSKVVHTAVGVLEPQQHKGKRALDLGCGNLRNSRFLSSLGFSVEAVDVAQPKDLARRRRGYEIKFLQRNLESYKVPASRFALIACTRVIQYLKPDTLDVLIPRIAKGLEDNGVAALSYTFSGRMIDEPDAPTQTFMHPVREVVDRFERQGLEIVSCEVGEVQTTATMPGFDLQGTVGACDLVAKK